MTQARWNEKIPTEIARHPEVGHLLSWKSRGKDFVFVTNSGAKYTVAKSPLTLRLEAENGSTEQKPKDLTQEELNCLNRGKRAAFRRRRKPSIK